MEKQVEELPRERLCVHMYCTLHFTVTEHLSHCTYMILGLFWSIWKKVFCTDSLTYLLPDSLTHLYIDNNNKLGGKGHSQDLRLCFRTPSRQPRNTFQTHSGHLPAFPRQASDMPRLWVEYTQQNPYGWVNISLSVFVCMYLMSKKL